MHISNSDFTHRPLDLERDLASLVILLNLANEADHDPRRVNEDELREQLTWSGKDPAEDNWAVEAPDGVQREEGALLIGWCQFFKTATDENADVMIYVHPSWRRQGIGSQLLAISLQHARALYARTIRTYVDIQNQGANLYARQHGFEPVSRYTHLKASTGPSFPEPMLPSGFALRGYEQVQDATLYHEAMNRSYEGLWGHMHLSEEESTTMLADYNHEDILLLFAPDGRVAGTSRSYMSEPLTVKHGVPTAYIDAPGIVPEYRSAGLYLPLFLASVHHVLSHHPAAIELESWGDAPETLASYRELGFSVVKEEISYCLELA